MTVTSLAIVGGRKEDIREREEMKKTGEGKGKYEEGK